MIELDGVCASAKIFADDVEDSALAQIKNVVNHPAFKDEAIRIMPDVHAGVGCVIGFTATFKDRIIPNIVGVDIGCGVAAWQLPKQHIDYQGLQEFIKHTIPHGHKVRGGVIEDLDALSGNTNFSKFVSDSCDSTGQDRNYVFKSIGTLGGGNHFIEIDRDDKKNLWLTVHSGSRNFGLKIANFHQRRAREQCGKMGGLEYLENDDAENYLGDMQIAQQYAQVNRRVIGHQILTAFFGLDSAQFESAPVVESVHNYVSTQDRIIRKGAISAAEGEEVIIPWNMRDGLVVGIGKGNSDWNFSAPHGAGRKMSRTEARQKLSLGQFEQVMQGVWSRSVSLATIDEAPFAYKDHEQIKRAIEPTVIISHVLEPVYNFKDDSGGTGHRRKKQKRRH